MEKADEDQTKEEAPGIMSLLSGCATEADQHIAAGSVGKQGSSPAAVIRPCWEANASYKLRQA